MNFAVFLENLNFKLRWLVSLKKMHCKKYGLFSIFNQGQDFIADCYLTFFTGLCEKICQITMTKKLHNLRNEKSD
jgi:hypothetical protein